MTRIKGEDINTGFEGLEDVSGTTEARNPSLPL
jgi:hypothetical protein